MVKRENSESFKFSQNVGLGELVMLCKFYLNRVIILGERRRYTIFGITSGFERRYHGTRKTNNNK